MPPPIQTRRHPKCLGISSKASAGTSAEASGRAERLIELSSRILRTLGIARALVDGRRNLDLTGVDDGIGILCAQTLDLAPEEARVMLPYLHAVLTQADMLSAAIHGRTQAET